MVPRWLSGHYLAGYRHEVTHPALVVLFASGSPAAGRSVEGLGGIVTTRLRSADRERDLSERGNKFMNHCEPAHYITVGKDSPFQSCLLPT